MKAIKVKKEDTIILENIVEIVTGNSDKRPSKAHLEKLLEDSRTFLMAAILDDKVIGYALAYSFPSLYNPGYLAYLYDIEVLSDHRRIGAGKLIMEALLTLLKDHEVTELWLGTATDNMAAQALFSATGGIRSGETFNDFTYELHTDDK